MENLAKELQMEFAGISGMSSASLWRMQAFCLTYQADEKLASLVREIGWSHNIVIMEKCKDDHERLFYSQQTRRNGWSKLVLIHQIKGMKGMSIDEEILFSNQSHGIRFPFG